ncbi:MAG TPA: thiamine pyrophosphate-requiring protein [Tepidisphaeraceae bacterium]|nr:thiamine pyrophosphate-requiring protein [Tepidisphaeraceae bacterium]
MAETVGDFLVKRLQAWGIERIYGYPGDGINGITAALRKAGDRPRFIQARHEELAAFMACAHAKYTGEVGVCMPTSGPGAIHLLNGLYDAKMDHQPVVAIVGQAAAMAIGGSYQQEVDLSVLFKDVASEYVVQVSSPEAIRHAIDRAIRIAIDQRSVTCVIVPKDIQEMEYSEAPQKHNTIHSGIGIPVPYMIPQQTDLHAAADLLNAGQRVAMLVGAGALGATDEVMKTAELLGAGVAKAWLGKAVLPDDLPYCTGAIGLLGSKPSWELMRECDTLLMVGSSFPYSEFLPKIGKAKAVQIDIDGRLLSIRYPMDICLKGDARQTLAALNPLLLRKRDRSWRDKIEEWNKSWEELVHARAMDEADPINPERLYWELSPKLPDNCILSCDSGTCATWFARDIKIRRGMMCSGSGNLATMGPAVPYSVAAKICFPDRVSIAFTGDGAMQMNGLNSVITVAKYWKEWSDPRWITLVQNNRDLNMVTWEQRVMTGDPKFESSQDLPDFPYAAYADSLGLRGIRVERPEQIASAWDQALSSDRPVIVEAICDPNVPVLPPHITLEQAHMLSDALIKGDPDAGGIIRQSVRAMVDTFTK